MGNFIEYRPCPNCGSKDNLAVYDDGQYCFGCNYTGRDDNGKASRITVWPPKGFAYSSISDRGLSRETCTKYSVPSLGPYVLFPSSSRRGYKQRNSLFAKGSYGHMSIEGEYKGFFGLETVHTKNLVAIAFGEYDAMSVFQATGIPCISPCNGDGSLIKAIKDHWSRLDSVEKIVFLPDNDDSGCLSKVEEAITLLGEDRSYVAKLSYKDPNEYSKRNEDYLLKKAFWAAEPSTSSLFYDSYDDMFQETGVGILSGIEPFDKLTMGLRGGEVTYVLGAPKMGKTTFVQYLMYQLSTRGVKVGAVCLEGGHKSFLTSLGHMFYGGNIFALSNADRKELQAAIKENIELAKLRGIVTPDDIIRSMKAAVKAKDCKVLVLDNLTSAGDPMKLFESSSKLVLMMDELAQELQVPIVVISHVNRMSYDRPPSMSSGSGTGHLEKFAYNILGVFRQETKARFEMIANRSIGPEGEGIFYGEFSKDTYQYRFSSVVKKDEWTYAKSEARPT